MLNLVDIEKFINQTENPSLPAYLEEINSGLARLGMENSRVEWWCYNAATRNPLGTRLIYAMLAYRCCLDAIKGRHGVEPVLLANTPRYLQTAINLYHNKTRNFLADSLVKIGLYINGISRVTILMLQALLLVWRFRSRKRIPPGSIGLFTYIDGGSRANGDAYFGNLADQIMTNYPGKHVEHLAYLYRPYNQQLARAGIDFSGNYTLLFAYLGLLDVIGTWLKCCWMTVFTTVPETDHLPGWITGYRDILKATMQHEISSGVFEHLLVFTAFSRLAASGEYDRIVYPFENKAIEKCLLLGVQKRRGIRSVGYQHSSITKRHFAFRLKTGEIQALPMPDRVITVGDITYDWMQDNGFPADRLVSGCSLRHKLDFDGKVPAKSWSTVKLLFALSSSRYELQQTVTFLRQIRRQNPQWELGIRCHPNFPLSLLGSHDQAWLKDNVTDYSGTPLSDNLGTTDILVYLSSTVALEALAAGIPVIRLNLELLNADPLLKTPEYYWECADAESFGSAVTEICDIEQAVRESAIESSRRLIMTYLKPFQEKVVSEFLN